MKTSKRKVFETSILKRSRRSKSRDLFWKRSKSYDLRESGGVSVEENNRGKEHGRRNGPAGVTCAAVADELQYDKPAGSGSPSRGRTTSPGLVN